MYNVRQILEEKGTEIWLVPPDASMKDALALLAEKDIGALLVVDKTRLVGILSERDIARRINEVGVCQLTTPVREMMTAKVYFVTPEDTIDYCMGLMTAHHIRHLPVMENKRLTGVISIGDVVKRSIESKEEMIRGLENYILGTVHEL